MKLRLLSTICLLSLAASLFAQAPNNTGTYYQKAQGKKGRELKTAMYEIINTPAVLEYDSLWMAYSISDARTPRGEIWDMYSCNSHYPSYPVDKTIHANGKYGTDPEGTKGFQREHSMPKSWFNPEAKSGKSLTYKDIWPHFSDLMHIVPAEGIVNNKRSNNPYGTNNGEWYKSEAANGDPDQKPFSKMGACTYIPEGAEKPVYNGRCFEPNDEYKGDFARIYFYMVTAYEKKQPTWTSPRDSVGDHCGTWTGEMFNTDQTDKESSLDPYQPFAPWALDMLMKWSKGDPVSEKEINRNEAVYHMQGNRNPFVDYPGLEEYIWGDKKDIAFEYGGEPAGEEPTSTNCEVALNKTTFGVDWHPSEERKAELTTEGKDWLLFDNLRDYYDRIPLTISKNNIDITYSFGICGRQMYADDIQIRLYNYNTLTLKAHNNKITKIEFTLGDGNHADKKLKTFVGTLDNNNVWTGEEDEVLFTTDYVASKYNSGTQTTTNYYAAVKSIKVTVANPTGITERQAPRQEDSRVFNLMGFQVNPQSAVPGIYVRNGQKYIRR